MKLFRFLTLIQLGLLLLASHSRGEAPIPTPELFSPIDGMQMTDVATYFNWAPVEGCNSFDIQIASDPAFKSLFLEKRLVNKNYHRNCYRPKDLLPPGTYHWRVRAVMGEKEGPWSQARTVTVNADHSIKAQVVREITPDSPLFLMRNRVWNPEKISQNIKEIIPPGFEHVIISDDLAMAGFGAIQRARRYQELGLDFVIWDNRCQVSLSLIEYIFQNFSHCIGEAEGEHFDGISWEKGPEGNLAEADFVHHAWALCAKYGRFYFFSDGDGGTYKWLSFMESEKENFTLYRRNIVPMFKTTKGDVSLHSYGAIEGIMAGGFAENCGIWVDEWCWPGCGFTQLGKVIPEEERWDNRRKVGTKECPWVYDIQMWLMGIAGGSTVFHVESAHQWTAEGKGAPQYPRVLLPFVKAVVQRHLLPSRQAYLQNIKLAVVSDPSLVAGNNHKQYTGNFAFIKELYALKGMGDQELIPNESRYGILCLLPHSSPARDTTGASYSLLPMTTKRVPQADLADPAQARKLFNEAYPRWFYGDAFVWACDGTLIITNSNENEDRPQQYALNFPSGTLRGLGGMRGIGGTIGVHQYLLGKIAKDGRSFWFQVNGEDPGREIEVRLACDSQPRFKCSPAAALKASTWNPLAKTLSIRLSPKAGAVEVEFLPWF